jgi:hypothetical protein
MYTGSKQIAPRARSSDDCQKPVLFAPQASKPSSSSITTSTNPRSSHESYDDSDDEDYYYYSTGNYYNYPCNEMTAKELAHTLMLFFHNAVMFPLFFAHIAQAVVGNSVMGLNLLTEVFTFFAMLGPFGIYWLIVAILGVSVYASDQYVMTEDYFLLWAYGF